MDKHYSPLRYPGGKSCIFQFVAKLFYENEFIGINYAEPYAGGSGLALRLLMEEYVAKIYINDLDRSIYSFWKAVFEQPNEFCSWIKDVDVTTRNWQVYKEIQTHANSVSDFELAKSTFFLNRTNISGVIKGGIIGGISQKGKYKINARFNKEDLIQRIKKIAAFRHRIDLSNLDGVSFINKLNKKGEEIFIYLDPPYLEKGADLYMNFYSNKDHQRLAQYVSKLNKRWMVSYDNHDFILNLYAEQKKILYKLSQCASNRIGDEILIFSKDLKVTDSVHLLKEPIALFT